MAVIGSFNFSMVFKVIGFYKHKIWCFPSVTIAGKLFPASVWPGLHQAQRGGSKVVKRQNFCFFFLAVGCRLTVRDRSHTKVLIHSSFSSKTLIYSKRFETSSKSVSFNSAHSTVGWPTQKKRDIKLVLSWSMPFQRYIHCLLLAWCLAVPSHSYVH